MSCPEGKLSPKVFKSKIYISWVTYNNATTYKIIINSKFMLFERLLNWKCEINFFFFVTNYDKMIDSILYGCVFWKVQAKTCGKKNDVVISWSTYY